MIDLIATPFTEFKEPTTRRVASAVWACVAIWCVNRTYRFFLADNRVRKLVAQPSDETVRGVIELGAVTIPHLFEVLETGDLDALTAATHALGEIGVFTDQTIYRLSPLTKHADPILAETAQRSIDRLGGVVAQSS